MINRFGPELAVGMVLAVALNGCAAPGEVCVSSGPLGELRDQGLEIIDDIPGWPVNDSLIVRIDSAYRQAGEISDANVSAEAGNAVDGALSLFVAQSAGAISLNASPEANATTVAALGLIVDRIPYREDDGNPNTPTARELARLALQTAIANAVIQPGQASNAQERATAAQLVTELTGQDLRLLVAEAQSENTSRASAAASELSTQQRTVVGQATQLAAASRDTLFEGSGNNADAINRDCAGFEAVVSRKGR